MKLPLRWLPLCCALASAPLSAADRLPIEDFAREPQAARMRLSPDGQSIAFLSNYSGLPVLHVSEIGKKSWRLDLGEAAVANGASKSVASFEWIGNQRLIATTAVWDALYGVVALDRNGDHAVPISGYEDDTVAVNGPKFFGREVAFRFFDKDQSILMVDRHEGSSGLPNRPDLVKVNTLTGQLGERLKNPGEVGSWGVDGHGVARLGILSHGDLSGVIYRENENASWRTILPLENRRGQLRIIGFDSVHEKIFVAALTKEQRWTVFPLDPATGQMGEPLLSSPEYDIVPDHFTPSLDGLALSSPIFSPMRDALLGIRYVTDAPRVQWFDRAYANRQRDVDRLLPDTVNLLVDISRDGKRMLWFAFSDQNPVAYYLADEEKHSCIL